MPLIVATTPAGADTGATSLTHDGQSYDGPVFDVPPDVAETLLARRVFRTAREDETPKPKPAKAPRGKA